MKLFQNVNWIVNRWRTVTVWCLAMLPACVAFGNKPNDSNNNSNTPACCRYTHKCGYNTCEYVLPGIATINTKSYTSIVVWVCECVSVRMSASVSCIWLLLHLPDKSCRPDQLYLTSHIHAYIYGLFFSIFVHTYSSLLSQFPKFTQFLATPYRLKIFPLNHWEVSSRDCRLLLLLLSCVCFMGGLFIKRSWRQFDIVVITINGKFLLFRRCRVSETCATIIPKI